MTKAVQELIDEAVQKALYERARNAGLAGGAARAKVLSPRRRKEIARKAARARWQKAKEKDGNES